MIISDYVQKKIDGVLQDGAFAVGELEPGQTITVTRRDLLELMVAATELVMNDEGLTVMLDDRFEPLLDTWLSKASPAQTYLGR